jgi:hypothetical protein
MADTYPEIAITPNLQMSITGMAVNIAQDFLILDSQFGSGGGLVTSVFGRNGDILALTGDYTVAMITGAAPIDSPLFTGTPSGPTAPFGTNTTQLATTAYVQANKGGGGGGSTPESVQTKSANATIGFAGAINTLVEATAGVGGITLTLPTAVGVVGQTIRIIMVDAGAGGVNIVTTSSQTINGATTYKLTNQWQTISMESDNANWVIVSSNG